MRTDLDTTSSAASPPPRTDARDRGRGTSSPRDRRRWYAGLVVVPLTIARTLSMLRHSDLGAFVPFVALLFMGAGVLWMVNAIAPLAPLIYSLF